MAAAAQWELGDIFTHFDEKPQGAASLAQVHKAVLADGRTVAVKVQHPKVQHQSSKDIVVMEFLLRMVHWLFPDFGFMWLVDEAKKNMPLELDFINEGRNADRIAEMLKEFSFLKIPKIHWDLSTKRVLTMDFVEGGQVNDREYMRKHCIDVNEPSWWETELEAARGNESALWKSIRAAGPEDYIEEISGASNRIRSHGSM
ncbi:hypothetical protein DNTS_014442 [Danionella cerebrum]|uniref:AarF domain-containing protein kinase 1 n=1 Tax=Danionella cerebrum TaxID=2873325 RepID=A0A553QJ23_9TELE|nr:hypothetical protein DNTS_014442 [Danionella translucida]